VNDPTLVPVIQLRAKGQVTIPLDIRQKLKLEPGDLLNVYVTEKREVVLVPQAIIERPSVKDFSPERVRRAYDVIRRGGS
jgi:AbrB family looped-hinge helix DNA binding protein